MRTIDSFLMKVNKTLQPCTQNIVKVMKSSSFDGSSALEYVEEKGTKAIHAVTQDGVSEAVMSPDKENTGNPEPHLDEPEGTVTQPVVSSLPEPKLSSFAIADFSVPIVTETKELTELERLKQRFTAQLVQTKKPPPPQASTLVPPLAIESQSLIPPDLVVQLKNKPGALRQHLHATLKRQLSQRRAEERKIAEEERKLYGEEGPEDVEGEGEEAELTDQDTTDVESLSDGEGVHGTGTKEKEERPGEEEGEEKDGDQKRDRRDNETSGKEDGPHDGKGLLSDGEGDHGDRGDPSDEEGDRGDPSDGEGDPSDDADVSSDDDDDITPFVKRNSTARKQRIDSDDEGGDPPTLKQSLSLGSSDSTLGNLVPGPSTSALQRETDERIVPLELENISVGKSNLERIASDITEGSQLQSDRPFGSLTPRGVRHEAAEICQTLAEKGEAVAQMDSGLGLSSQENPCSQLLVDVSSQEGPPHLQTISKEGSHLRGASDEGSDLNCLVAEDTLGAGDISSVDTSFSSFPPAQPRHSPNPKVSRTCRKDSTVSNQSDQKLFEAQTTDGSQDPFDTDSNAQAWSKEMSCAEDSQTQFLDAQGYLCVDKRSSTRSLVKTVATPALEEPSDELLDLCSGSFATQDAPRGVVRFPLIHKKPVSGLLSSVAMATSTLEEGTQGTDILALCSGVFPSGSPSQYATQGDGGEEEEGGKGVLERWALRHSQAPQKQDGEEESEDEDMPLLLKRRASLPKPKPTASERLQEFVESEAELSGEDVGPDEEEDDRGGPDEYEEEEGVELEAGLSETELRDQVTRVHTKHTLADDKAELLELQERFLKEGDLYEDGLALRNGFFRTRHFGPTGSEGSVDLFVEDRTLETELDMEEDNSQAEALRRKDKLEREEFVRKCRERESSRLEIDEDSQSILNIIRDTSSHSLLNTPTTSKTLDDSSTPSNSSAKKSRGSFLKHDTATLRRLSSITAVTPNISNKAFVFQKSTPGHNETPTHSSKIKSGNSVSKNKRPKLDESISLTISESSVFSLLK
eukprot:Em0019g232a